MKQSPDKEREQRREQAHKRQSIGALLGHVRELQEAVGRAQYEHGAFPEALRWELEEALSGVESKLWSEWKTPSINSEPSPRKEQQ